LNDVMCTFIHKTWQFKYKRDVKTERDTSKITHQPQDGTDTIKLSVDSSIISM